MFLATRNSLASEGTRTLTSSSKAEEDISKVEEEIDRRFETDSKSSQQSR